MKKTLTNQFGSAILDAFMPKSFESRYLEKTKMLSNSKSSKALPNSYSIENAFKKGSKKVELQVEPKDKKEKQSVNKQENFPSKMTNKSNKSEKSTNIEFNKFSNNTNTKVGHNPEHFFTRNQQFEKQKQLKLQYQRRKQLYGVTSDLKFKSSLIIKQNQETKADPNTDSQQKSKSYKFMYEKKYGKFKIQEDNNKKKVKKYQELMKESMARFQQKFKELGVNHPESGKIKESILDVQNINQQERIEQMMINTLIKEQTSTNSNAIVVKPTVEDIDKKIQFLMQKLQIQDQFNDSIESISELSRIQLKSDIKGSQMNSSNLFNKVDNQAILKEEFIGFQTAKQLQDHSLAYIDKQKHQEETKNNHYSLQYIEQPQAQYKQQQHENVRIQMIQQRIQQKLLPEFERINTHQSKKDEQQQIQKQQQAQNYFEGETNKQQVYNIEPKQGLVNDQQQIHSQYRKFSQNQTKLDKQKPKSQIQQMNEVAKTIDLNSDKNAKIKEQPIVMLEDLSILGQTSFKFPQIQSFSFKEIQYPRVSYEILGKQLVNPHEQSIINKEIRKKLDKTQNLVAQIESNKNQHLENSQKHEQNKKPQQSQPQQQFDKQQSSQDQYETHIESFIDLHGNFIEDAEVEVQNFGYCRFLAIEEESERLSQDSYS